MAISAISPNDPLWLLHKFIRNTYVQLNEYETEDLYFLQNLQCTRFVIFVNMKLFLFLFVIMAELVENCQVHNSYKTRE